MKKVNKLTVTTEGREHPVFIGRGILEQIGSYLARHKQFSRAFVLSDEHVFALYGKKILASLQETGIKTHVLTIAPGEESKSLNQLSQVYTALVEGGITRSDVLIALGGGVIGDLGGFGAATYLRGISYIQIPTSLLAQVDSSVGGKVAVDLPQGKNLVGAFYQPTLVWLDFSVLATLPNDYWVDGMGEVIKYGCIGDEGLFAMLEKEGNPSQLMAKGEALVTRCLTIKKHYVEKDPYDKGERMILNFGHTFGHAIEGIQQYKGLSHGRGVAVGMMMAASLGEKIGVTPAGVAQRLKACLITHGLPYAIKGLSMEELIKWIQKDKKVLGDTLNLILLEKIGKAQIYPVKIAELTKESLWKP